ncbi:hypothetical protein JB92DRAFT_152871 [Gautieria morchelliformis]|nr:hypothetical protein JB92DRAFT_152871 [Gautieria morchelliformis]
MLLNGSDLNFGHAAGTTPIITLLLLRKIWQKYYNTWSVAQRSGSAQSGPVVRDKGWWGSIFSIISCQMVIAGLGMPYQPSATSRSLCVQSCTPY